ncbi:unnamed protein product [Darwinula stevensoni]|uniref:Uncharacterized protein n=1 Tax=Darwinula stevensoni TaxID=69355 RepID=A0A7R8XAD9_9CRUS|nr:unnamed protein product [Darwinula stevensoni]CAG0889878.1 unnamed protein product [Darwinula stevensoni]
MGCENDVIRIQKKLDKHIKGESVEPVLDLLKRLQELPIDLDVLTKTRIGMTVNSLRKLSKEEEVVTLAKTLIKNWKKFLVGGGSNMEDSNPASEKNFNGSESKAPDPKKKPDTPTPKTTEVSFPRSSGTTDIVRLKSREMLANAIRGEGGLPEDSKDPEELANDLEDAIFQEFRNTEFKYKTRIRSRMMNLRDSKNPNLRLNFLLGHIAPSRLAVMTPEEMAIFDLSSLKDMAAASLTRQVLISRLAGPFLRTPEVFPQQIRTTFILKRRREPFLSKKYAAFPRPLKRSDLNYELVQDTNIIPRQPLQVILTQYVEGYGVRGDVLSLQPHEARKNILLLGKGVYATPENLKLYEKVEGDKDETQTYSSQFVPLTVKQLKKQVICIYMNGENPWTIEPWHLRVSLRAYNVVVPEHAIEMPSIPISGPNLTLEGKEFYATIVINGVDHTPVRFRIYHHFKDPMKRIERDPDFIFHPAGEVFPEQKEVLDQLRTHLSGMYKKLQEKRKKPILTSRQRKKGSDLTDVGIVKRLPNVEVLSLSVNKISSLWDFQHCRNLQELYLRNNSIRDLNEVCYLKDLPKLRCLWLAENPCAEGDLYRLTVLKHLPRLQKLDNEVVEPEELHEAQQRGLDLIHPSERTQYGSYSQMGIPGDRRSLSSSVMDPDPYRTVEYTEAPTRRVSQISNSSGGCVPPSRRPSQSHSEREEGIPSRRTTQDSYPIKFFYTAYLFGLKIGGRKLLTSVKQGLGLKRSSGYGESVSNPCPVHPHAPQAGDPYSPSADIYSSGDFYGLSDAEMRQAELRQQAAQGYSDAYSQGMQQMEGYRRTSSSPAPSTRQLYMARPKNRNSNIMSAVLCLIKELDIPSLEVVEMAVRSRIEELED